MKRSTRAEKAKETLDIIEHGFYSSASNTISIGNETAHSVSNSILYRSDEFEEVLQDSKGKQSELKYNTIITVENTTVLNAASKLCATQERVGCLNFASAKNPGGGFLGGAMAQEESLALSSTLYPTLTKHFEMYEYNRARTTYLYSDYMIYSPDVVMMRNDEGDLLAQPYQLSIVTSPAVNIGAMKNNRPEEIEYAEASMLVRMEKMLALFVHHNIEHLVLGAWGCGVFQNNPEDIARYFSKFLLAGRAFSSSFKSIVFAVFDRSKEESNVNAFRQYFK